MQLWRLANRPKQEDNIKIDRKENIYLNETSLFWLNTETNC
jgi:hypothetical protein